MKNENTPSAAGAAAQITEADEIEAANGIAKEAKR